MPFRVRRVSTGNIKPDIGATTAVDSIESIRNSTAVEIAARGPRIVVNVEVIGETSVRGSPGGFLLASERGENVSAACMREKGGWGRAGVGNSHRKTASSLSS